MPVAALPRWLAVQPEPASTVHSRRWPQPFTRA